MRSILVLFLLISTAGYSQPWKDFIISVRGDTLNRVDMKGRKQGPWVVHVDALRGEQGYDEQGYFMDDKKDGLWVKFSPMGDKIAEEHYKFGSKDGKSRYYTLNGGLLREESWRAVDPNKTMDTVDVFDINDPTKVVDRVIVKLEGQTNRHGTWTYFEPVWGTIQKTERYFLDKLQTGAMAGTGEEGDEEIRPLDVTNSKTGKTDSLGNKIVVKPQAVLDYEKKNSGKKKVKTRDGNTGL
jgi:hypothetical protein